MTTNYPADLQGGNVRFKTMKKEEMNQYPTEEIAAPSGQNITTDDRDTIRTASKAVPVKKVDGSIEVKTASGIEGKSTPEATIRSK
jgi:hypothetical protein